MADLFSAKDVQDVVDSLSITHYGVKGMKWHKKGNNTTTTSEEIVTIKGSDGKKYDPETGKAIERGAISSAIKKAGMLGKFGSKSKTKTSRKTSRDKNGNLVTTTTKPAPNKTVVDKLRRLISGPTVTTKTTKYEKVRNK